MFSMASFPRLCSNYQFYPDELSEIMSATTQENRGAALSGCTVSSGAISPAGVTLDDETNVPMSFENINELDFLPSEFDIPSPPMTSFPQQQQLGIFDIPSPPMTSFPQQQQLGIFDTADPTLMLECKIGLRGGSAIANDQNFGAGFQLSDVCQNGMECKGCGFKSNSNPVSPASAAEIWVCFFGGINCNKMPAIEHINFKVGRYTEEERKDRILRYLKKRNQRNFNKTIKYACRKTLADRRVRVRGRFARNNELCKEEMGGMKPDRETCDHQETESYYSDAAQSFDPIKMDDDEEWLQDAVASLLYVPYIAG